MQKMDTDMADGTASLQGGGQQAPVKKAKQKTPHQKAVLEEAFLGTISAVIPCDLIVEPYFL
jgi:hypothetical protein